MELVPSQQDVISLLSLTGALRDGHFVCPSGFHTGQYLETSLLMRHYRYAKTLSVGLSRLIRANPELRSMLPELSIVAGTSGGLPVAYGLCEALRCRQVYWAERPQPGQPLRLRQFLEPSPGEKVLLVDDILRFGAVLEEVRSLVEARGAKVVGLAVLVYQPTPATRDFGSLPLYYLARLDASYYIDAERCELCGQGVPLERIGQEQEEAFAAASATAAMGI